MDNRISTFLTKHHIAALTVTLSDGTLHAAALHFSHQEEPTVIYFSTDRTSRKCQGLLNGEVQQAALVVGLSEEEWVTVQMDGEVQAISDETELARVQAVHYAKHPGSEKYKDDPATIFLKFTPKWWRYTDFNTEPVTLLESE